MPKKLFLSPVAFQPSPTRLRLKSNSRRSKSLDQKSSTRRSPNRGRISFQIREKKEHFPPTTTTMDTPQSSSPTTKQQNHFPQSAFDPFSTSFTSIAAEDSNHSHSPTTIMDVPSFGPTFFDGSSSSKAKTLSPTFQHKEKTFKIASPPKSKSQSPTPLSNHEETHSPKRKPSNRIIPGVSKMTMRQTLAVIFSAFWERADLYTDVLALAHDKPSARQLRLAFFRQGRIVLATPIESPDDMTTIDAGTKPIFAVGGGSASNKNNNNNYNDNSVHSENRHVVQSGVTVSRKAKIKFQAINLAYDLLNDPEKRKAYNEWRLWHCRLPNPMEVPSPKKQPDEDAISLEGEEEGRRQQQSSHYQKLTNQELHNIIKEGNTFKQPQCSFDSNTSGGTGTDDSSPMGRSINSKSSLPSILRSPTIGKKKRKNLRLRSLNRNESNRSSSSERRITWNEEVEELVILECSRDQSDESIQNCDLPTRDSCQHDSRKENIDPFESNVRDPYQNQTMEDDWFAQRSALHSRKTQEHQDPQSFNFMSLQDSRLTFVESSSSRQGEFTNNGADDSLIDILDAPNGVSQVQDSKQPNSWSEKVGMEMKERREARYSPLRVSEEMRAEMKEWQVPRTSPIRGMETKPGHNIVEEETFRVGGRGNKNNVKINVRSYQKDNNVSHPSQVTSSNITQKSTNLSDSSPVDLFEKYKQAQHELDVDEFSIDTKSTKDTYDSYNWKSQGQSTEGSSFADHNDCAVWGQSNDCALFGQQNNCNGFHRSPDCSSSRDCIGVTNDCGSIDLAKGFQATLSNYINAAVSDMKEGLMNLGKKWEENVPKMSENGENPFMLNSFELDAMMDILKVEMNTISPHLKGRDCTG